MFENPNPTDAVGMDQHSEFDFFFFSCSFDSSVLCLMSFDHATSPCTPDVGHLTVRWGDASRWKRTALVSCADSRSGGYFGGIFLSN